MPLTSGPAETRAPSTVEAAFARLAKAEPTHVRLAPGGHTGGSLTTVRARVKGTISDGAGGPTAKLAVALASADQTRGLVDLARRLVQADEFLGAADLRAAFTATESRKGRAVIYWRVREEIATHSGKPEERGAADTWRAWLAQAIPELGSVLRPAPSPAVTSTTAGRQGKRISEEVQAEILRMAARGMTRVAIAEACGVSERSVYSTLRGAA